MAYYVYILRNPKGRIYVGQTNDLKRRLFEHNDADFHGTLYTKRFTGPWVLVYSEEYKTRSEAMMREKFFKMGRGREFIRNLMGGGC